MDKAKAGIHGKHSLWPHSHAPLILQVFVQSLLLLLASSHKVCNLQLLESLCKPIGAMTGAS